MRKNYHLLDYIVDKFQKKPKVAILMSGQGTNAEIILKRHYEYPNIQFVAVVTDQSNSRGKELADIYGLNYICITGQVKQKEEREAYFLRLEQKLNEVQVDLTVYSGFMKIASPSFVKHFPGINIHPADMTVLTVEGKPKYRGINAIQDAIDSGETYIASTIHVVDNEVDCGSVIAVSNRLNISELQSSDLNEIHRQLKVTCEHLTFPYVIKKLNEGSLKIDSMPLQLDQDPDFQNYKQEKRKEKHLGY